MAVTNPLVATVTVKSGIGYFDDAGTALVGDGSTPDVVGLGEAQALARNDKLVGDNGGTKASLVVNPAGANNQITYTAVTAGTAGNRITVGYTISGAGSTPTVTVSDVAYPDVTILVTGGTSTTANSVLAEIAKAPANKWVTAANSGGDDGTGAVATVAAAPLASGADPVENTTNVQMSARALKELASKR